MFWEPPLPSGSRASVFTRRGVEDVEEEAARPWGPGIARPLTVDREAVPGRRSAPNRGLPAQRDGAGGGLFSFTLHHAISSSAGLREIRFGGSVGAGGWRAAEKWLLLCRAPSAVYGLSRGRSLPAAGLREVV